MAEREISITGSDPEPEKNEEIVESQQLVPSDDGESSTAGKDISTHTPDRSKDIKPDASRTDVLDFILGLKQDEIIPWEPMWLPSRGYYYEGAIPNGKIEVRAMGLYADKVLATQRLHQSGFTLEYIFKNCVKFPNSFDPLDLISGDRSFLLYVLRGITHGNIYEFIHRCANDSCKKQNTYSYDLNRLMENVTSPKDNKPEPFKVVLPYLSDMVGREFFIKLRFMRGRDMQQMREREKVLRKIGGGVDDDSSQASLTVDETLEQNLNLLIIEAMGSTDPAKIETLVRKMHGKDTGTIRHFLTERTPGIETTINLTCPDCEEEMRVELPLTESFFRPTEGGGVRKGVEPSDGAVVPT